MQEHILDFSPPEKFRGHRCTMRIELYCDTGNWKSGWNFEGFAVSFNNQANMKQNDYFPHSKTMAKKQE
jgi:hypothetical protein